MITTPVTQAKSYNSPSLLFFLTQNLKLSLSKTFAWGMRNTLFWQMREEELRDFVTQEAQSVSAHWCSELAGLSLWSPINSAVRLLPPSPRCAACPYTQPTHCRSAPLHRGTLVPALVLLLIWARLLALCPCPINSFQYLINMNHIYKISSSNATNAFLSFIFYFSNSLINPSYKKNRK